MSCGTGLAAFRDMGIEIWEDEGRVRCRGPRHLLTDDVRRRLTDHRDALLDELLGSVRPDHQHHHDPGQHHHGQHHHGQHRHGQHHHGGEPFPLTGIQQAYWVGRTDAFELGNTSAHTYLELESEGLDLERLEHAWNRVVRRHGMLRAVVRPDGLQQVLAEVPAYSFAVLDLTTSPDATAEVQRVRDELSHQVFDSARWPLWEIRATRLPQGRTRVHVSGDVIIADAASWQLVFRDWGRLYADPGAELPALRSTFRDYVLAEAATAHRPERADAERYWRSRVAELPAAPDLPLAVDPRTVERARFVRRVDRVDAPTWQRLRDRCAAAGLTPSSVLLGAFAHVIAGWSTRRRCLLSLTLFNRLPLVPDAEELVGDFTSFTLVDTGEAAESFLDLAGRMSAQLLEGLEHSALGGVDILRMLAQTRDRRSGAAAPVVFTSLLHPQDEAMAPFAWLGRLVDSITQTPQVWLDHQVFEDGGDLVLNWDFVEQLFPAGMAEAMLAGYVALLRALADDPGSWDGPLPSALPPEQQERRRDYNRTAGPRSDACLHELVAARVAETPDAPAVVTPARTLSYAELDRRANAVARWLRRRDVARGSLVAVVMHKGWEQVVAVLGVLRAGAAYLPIDPDHPAERRRLLIRSADVSTALTQSWLCGDGRWPDGVERLPVDLARTARTAPPTDVSPDDLAYVIFTSGSTGEPKGVVIDHRSAVNTVLDVNRRFTVSARDRVLGVSALTFDLSVYDVFGTLAAGGALVLPDASSLRDPAHWAEMMRGTGVTVWNSAPALMELFTEYAEARPGAFPPDLRLVMLSGDWVPVTLPDRLRAHRRDLRVVSLGGATEGAIWSIFHDADHVDPDAPSIPYGRPLTNQTMHVLDEAMGDAPELVPGQIHIGGAGVARGYWRAPELTAAAFVTHPRTGERLYRTGDLGRFLPSGVIEFLGRNDSQVKVNGFRIELEEIEAALLLHPGVRAAAVVAVGPRGDRRLVAHVVGDPSVVPALREHLQARLPGYMVPGRLVAADTLPLTGNGKVDRAALAAASADVGRAASADATVPAPAAGTAPDDEPDNAPDNGPGDVLDDVLELVRQVLPGTAVDAGTDLLASGATSLDLVRLANALEERFSSRPRMEELFSLTTPAEIAGFYAVRPAPGSEEAPPPAPAPASPGSLAAVLVDEEERARFKAGRPGHRRPPADARSVPLPPPDRDLVRGRRSVRSFASGPVTLARLGTVLSLLGHDGEEDRRAYPSASGLYPVQSYLHVPGATVQGLDGGSYYWSPYDHRLVDLRTSARLGPAAHAPTNRVLVAGSAFTLVLAADLAAVEPAYGELARDFAALEAGAITQVLMTAAGRAGLGLCPLGTVDPAQVRSAFDLTASHVVLMTLVGGPLADEPPADSHEEGAL